MSIKEENIERVEKYLRGEMSANEAIAFENELSKNQELREALDFVRDIRKGVAVNKIHNLKAQLQEVDKKKSGGFKWLAIAASIALIATVGYFALNQSREVDTKVLYEEFYSPYPNVVAPTSRSVSEDSLNAYQLYEQGKYERALNLFKSLKQNDTVRFYSAQTLIALNEEEEALAQFSSVEEGNFSAAAKWYEALIYLKQQKQELALEKLNALIDDNGDYSEKARDLKARL